jgi:hypothetical protein
MADGIGISKYVPASCGRVMANTQSAQPGMCIPSSDTVLWNWRML